MDSRQTLAELSGSVMKYRRNRDGINEILEQAAALLGYAAATEQRPTVNPQPLVSRLKVVLSRIPGLRPRTDEDKSTLAQVDSANKAFRKNYADLHSFGRIAARAFGHDPLPIKLSTAEAQERISFLTSGAPQDYKLMTSYPPIDPEFQLESIRTRLDEADLECAAVELDYLDRALEFANLQLTDAVSDDGHMGISPRLYKELSEVTASRDLAKSESVYQQVMSETDFIASMILWASEAVSRPGRSSEGPSIGW